MILLSKNSKDKRVNKSELLSVLKKKKVCYSRNSPNKSINQQRPKKQKFVVQQWEPKKRRRRAKTVELRRRGRIRSQNPNSFRGSVERCRLFSSSFSKIQGFGLKVGFFSLFVALSLFNWLNLGRNGWGFWKFLIFMVFERMGNGEGCWLLDI